MQARVQARVDQAARSVSPAGIRRETKVRTRTGYQEPVTLATPAASLPALSRSGRRHTVDVRPLAVARFHRRPKAGWERPSNPNPNPTPSPISNPSLSPSLTGRALACRFGDRAVIAEFVNVSAVRRPPPAAARATTVATYWDRLANPNPNHSPNPNPNPSTNPNPNPHPHPTPTHWDSVIKMNDYQKRRFANLVVRAALVSIAVGSIVQP